MTDVKEPPQRRLMPKRYHPSVEYSHYRVQMVRSGVATPPTSMLPPATPLTDNNNDIREEIPEEESDEDINISTLDTLPYKCYCGRRFSTEQDYSEHTEHQKCVEWDSILFKDDRVICACGEEFTEPLGLDIHLSLRECVDLFPNKSPNSSSSASP